MTKQNTKIKTGFFIVLMLMSSLAIAQPNYKLGTYRPTSGKKAGYYNTQAKSFHKRGAFNKAVANAVKALKLATKKGQIAKAQEILQEDYEVTVGDNVAAIEDLESQSSTFKDDNTVAKRATIVNMYKEMEDYNRTLRSLQKSSKDKFSAQKKKGADLEIEIENFSSQLRAAKTKFEKGKEEAAAMHYAKADDLMEQGGLQNNKKAARRFKWANTYVPDFKDAMTKYEKARKLGTTRMAVLKFKNSTRKEHLYGDISEVLTDKLISDLFNNSKYTDLAFFQVMTRDQMDKIIAEQKLDISGLVDETTTVSIGNIQGVQVLMVGKLNTVSVTKQNLQPKSEEMEKQVVVRREKYKDSEGKEKTRNIMGTVHAHITTYSKEAEAIVTGSYKIISVQTGAIIKTKAVSGKFKFRHAWARSSGDKRALHAGQQKLITLGDKAYPADGTMVTNATYNLASQLINGILDFAVTVGK